MRTTKSVTRPVQYGVYATRKDLVDQSTRRDNGLALTPTQAEKALKVLVRSKPVSESVKAKMGLPAKGEFVKVWTYDAYTLRKGSRAGEKRQKVLFIKV